MTKARYLMLGGFLGAGKTTAVAKLAERLSLQGNPAPKDDWYKDPKTGELFDFIMFARTEGRFAKHFDKDGNPSELLMAANQDRLDNWHTLQELAGII